MTVHSFKTPVTDIELDVIPAHVDAVMYLANRKRSWGRLIRGKPCLEPANLRNPLARSKCTDGTRINSNAASWDYSLNSSFRSGPRQVIRGQDLEDIQLSAPQQHPRMSTNKFFGMIRVNQSSRQCGRFATQREKVISLC